MLFLSSKDMMKSQMLGTLLWMAFLLSPAILHAQVFQWTDARGVIHWTDNLHSVPDSLRGSPSLIIRQDLDVKRTSWEIFDQAEDRNTEPVSPPKAPEIPRPTEPEQKTAAPPTIQYSPQFTNVVVINSTVLHLKKRPCPSSQGCQGVFRPNFDDRRFIHPSVFDGGSRQYIHPGLSQPPRK